MRRLLRLEFTSIQAQSTCRDEAIMFVYKSEGITLKEMSSRLWICWALYWHLLQKGQARISLQTI